MVIINYILFIILTYYLINLLFGSGSVVKHPLYKNAWIKLNNFESFWCLLFATGVVALQAAGALDLMAVRLLMLEILCIVVIFINRIKPIVSGALILYMLYLLWVFIGCFYGPSFSFGGRVILKYSYPLIIALASSSIVSDELVFFKSGMWARKVAVVSVIVGFIPFVENSIIPGVFWYATARAINYISIFVFSLGLFFFYDNKKKNLFYTILFMLPCFIWVFRTSIMGTGVALMAFLFFKYRMAAIPYLMGILMGGMIIVFTYPPLHEKMFKGNTSMQQFQKGQVTMDDVNTNARAAMWEHLEKRFYVNHETIGSGTGSVQEYMYNNFIFGGVKIPHSDYVQMRCDNGEIGFWLYVIALLSILIHCFTIYWKYESKDVKFAAIVAGSSLAGVMATLYSDNVVNYSMATLSMPFGFYGMLLGMLRNNNQDYDFSNYTTIQ